MFPVLIAPQVFEAEAVVLVSNSCFLAVHLTDNVFTPEKWLGWIHVVVMERKGQAGVSWAGGTRERGRGAGHMGNRPQSMAI
jgi:hypothetical protein